MFLLQSATAGGKNKFNCRPHTVCVYDPALENSLDCHRGNNIWPCVVSADQLSAVKGLRRVRSLSRPLDEKTTQT